MDENDKCHNCGIEGFSGPSHLPGDNVIFEMIEQGMIEEIPKGLAALFLYSHELYCYPCYCVFTSTCIHCGEVKETIFKDERCKNNLYLCSECLKEPTCPHLYKCYKDGCMSADEFAQHEFEMMKDGFNEDWDDLSF